MAEYHRVFVALGSNIDPERHLNGAVRLLAERCKILAISPVYQTRPVGTVDQPDFYNAAALIETNLSAAALKTQVLADIEQTLHRVRTSDKNAPRTIDLDIALFGSEILELGHRHIPDPDLLTYPHVAVPVADLAPQFVHPETGQTLQEIVHGMDLAGLQLRPEIRLWQQPQE